MHKKSEEESSSSSSANINIKSHINKVACM